MSRPSPGQTDALDLDTLFAAQAGRALELRTSGTAERCRKIEHLGQALIARRNELAAALRSELGKPEVETELTELLPVVDEIRHARRHLARWMRPRRVSPTLTAWGTRGQVVCQPRGRCLIIGPWNYPVNTLLGPLVSAVAAGNTVVLKPSEFTPQVNAVVAAIVGEVFQPEEVALVEGAVATSTHLLSLPFDHIFFTGSPAVGKLVMAAAARHLASVTLELGGKSPVVVDASADLRHAAEHLMWGKFVNAGQTCVAPDHVYIHRQVQDRFEEICRDVIARRFGARPDDIATTPDLGRMIHTRHAARTAHLLDEAVQSGARVVCGGTHAVAARYVAPTLLADVPATAGLQTEEIFGPVLPLISYDDLDEVVARINAAPKPLAMYVFTRDPAVRQRLLQHTSSGSLGVNLCLQQYAHPNLPFGGVNQSGLGHAHGWYGFQAFSHERAVLQAGRWSALQGLFPPYSPSKLRWSRRLVALVQRL